MKKILNKTGVFIITVLFLTYVIQFIPIILRMDMENTSISSFDFASIFFIIGGMMPSLMGVFFVLITYQREERKDYFMRCLLPTKKSWFCIAGALQVISLEVAVTQFIATTLYHSTPFGFSGIKTIIKAPYMFFFYLFWGLMSGPISEEFGWRGYLQDRFNKKYSMLHSSLLIGMIWGIWHLPLYFYPSQAQYQWIRENVWLGIGFLVNCITYALVYNIFYVISERRVFVIFFVHMFENIVPGRMIYPFSVEFSNLIVPVTIGMDILFYLIMSNTKIYKSNLEKIKRE